MKISVITVCYNSDETIGHTLRSVREQTYGNIEHIIVDGGSKDTTLAVVATEGQHVAKIVSERDEGIYDAMNKGITLATGEIVGFINADDFYASTSVLADVAAAFSKSGADSCYGDLCYVSQTDSTRVVRYWRSKDFVPGAFDEGWCPPHPTFFVRQSVYKRLGGFDLSFKIAADFELMARYLEAARITSYYIPEVLVKMRLGGTTNRSLSNIFKQNAEIRRALSKIGRRSSMVSFVLNKLVSRAIQFVRRPV
ncbi:glycosyltransferase family 2 protein [Rhodoferax sp. U11-2br]|uniref:glycosyltransferase family 2 protein n=1 Tax=Rhodoferax sp. U11-2br TaxID=2838878 RepID=UPI001BEB74F4|nr:glycosyltransferase family 2 protein [Rhodoferax sp. U11-2br]MBT3068368.1 glycosyltransferase [Rhodoferax sp. U11-2br]